VPTHSSEDSAGPIVTMRFEHREDEDGHHVLIGREGKLTRCEDEPIRVPGAVQGFGVLMVLHDDRKTGKLPVRQVSEVCYLFIIKLNDVRVIFIFILLLLLSRIAT
jgi:hypothetical protein